MNSVHEQCPNSDSETILSPKTGWVHQVHSLLDHPAHPGEHRYAWPCRGTPSESYRRPQPAVSWARRVAGVVPRAWLLCRGLAGLYCDTTQPCLAPFSHNTPECIAIQKKKKKQPAPFMSQYTQCIVIQTLPTCTLERLSHDTIFVL